MNNKNNSKSGVTDGLKIVSYQSNGGGICRSSLSDCWHGVDEVNQQAWQVIEKEINDAARKVEQGKYSCLYYYMVANQMDIPLLAGYTNQLWFRVWLHLRPYFFARVSDEVKRKYSELFQVTPEDLSAGRLLPPVYAQSGRDS